MEIVAAPRLRGKAQRSSTPDSVGHEDLPRSSSPWSPRNGSYGIAPGLAVALLGLGDQRYGSGEVPGGAEAPPGGPGDLAKNFAICEERPSPALGWDSTSIGSVETKRPSSL